jgi:hypothetical protein
MPFRNIDDFCTAYQRLEAKAGMYSWAALDRALVNVCAASPLHVQVDEVSVKIAIINRMYRANLQYGAKDAERKVAEKFVKNHADAIVAPLRKSSNFSSKSLRYLLDAHEKLVDLTRQVTKKVHNSFLSKYLHFHFPSVVPIFDKYAYNASWELAPLPIAKYAQYDKRLNQDYACHCASLLQIMKELKDRDVKSPSVKLLDVLLYGAS